MTFTARPGSAAERSIKAIRQAGCALTRTQLATAIGVSASALEALLEAPVRHGAIVVSTNGGIKMWDLPAGSAEAAPWPAAEEKRRSPIVREMTKRARKKKAEPKARAARKAKPAPKAKRARPQRVKRVARRPAKEVLPPPVPEVQTSAAPLASFGLFSDGSLAMERGAERVFCIDCGDTYALLRYLISQKALVDELFPESPRGTAS